MLSLFSPKNKIVPAEVGGVRVKPSVRARRLSLRIDARAGDVVLVWPRRASEKSALQFVCENRRWIETQKSRLTGERLLQAGDKVSVRGCDYVIEHRSGRGVTRFEGDAIVVHGDIAHFPRRLRDFLKKESRRVLTECAREKTRELNLYFKSLRVIDPNTRWGSCGHDGRLMFSWRLILAPEDVLDYVVAHEIAHLVHMNHSKKFWALCASLTKDAAASRRWLREHGMRLLRFQ